MSEITITEDMAKAISLIEKTDQHVFITGKAGTGKTTFLKHLVSHLDKQSVVTASTGIAAINAGGVTLHSLFKIPFGVHTPEMPLKGMVHKDTFELLNTIQVLIIDEISMVRPDVLDYVDHRCQQVRGNDKSFGGLQVVMFGDLYQLPPVIKRDEAKILDEFYAGGYFFNAHTFTQKGFNVIELNHIFRQSDPRFIEILNNIRTYNMKDEDIEDLSELRDKYISNQYQSQHIHICTHKKDVERINQCMLGQSTHTFKASTRKNFNIEQAPCDKELKLRIGARVMTLVNNPTQGYYNGSLGVVSAIHPDKIIVDLDNGCQAVVEEHTWESCEYKLEKGIVKKNVKGTCTQYPLALAWAITIHKSQGLQFPNIIIHTKGTFCSGQIYVALSRCTSMEGIVCDSFITRKHIMADKDLLRFEETYKASNNYYIAKV